MLWTGSQAGSREDLVDRADSSEGDDARTKPW